MPRTSFDALPDDARLWVFAAEEPLTGDPVERLLATVDAFLDGWNAHGHPLTAGRAWRDDRFLLVAVDERSAPPSGCSIDAMVRVLKEFEQEHGVTLTDHARVLWRDGEGEIHVADRPTFARLAREGTVDLDTQVFDTTLTRVGQLREGGLELPAAEGWHRRAFWRQAAHSVGWALLGGAVAMATLLGSGAAAAARAQEVERATFLTRLGEDTLAVERMAVSDRGIEAEVLLRSPEVTFARYRLARGSDGGLESYTARVWAGVDDAGEPVRTETLECGDGGCAWSLRSARGGREAEVDLPPDAVPFVNLLHWPFETALRERVASGEPLLGEMPMLSGSRVMTYRVVETAAGELGLRHPSRGVSTVTVSDRGELLTLDGYGTTLALTVERIGDVDLEHLAARFAALGPMGELSGRGEADVEVDGATVVLDWGVPRKRGREIFGTLVAYGEVWRTGANAATHVTFDRDVVVGGTLEVPAGTYTLFTVPREDGATLFFNTRTGINGQSYDPEADLGSVEMRREALDDEVEAFTVGVRDTPDGGVLELLWDRTAYRVDFEVR